MSTLKSLIDYAISHPEESDIFLPIVDRIKECTPGEALEVVKEIILELYANRQVLDQALRFNFQATGEVGALGRSGCERATSNVAIEDQQEAISPGIVERSKESLRHEIFNVLRKQLESNRWYALRLEETQFRAESMMYDRRGQTVRLEAIYRPLSRT